MKNTLPTAQSQGDYVDPDSISLHKLNNPSLSYPIKANEDTNIDAYIIDQYSQAYD